MKNATSFFVRNTKTLKITAFLLLLCVLFHFASQSIWSGVNVDYSQKPPDKVFQMVLNQPVPRGVSNLRVAGHGLMVWMKFSATDAAMNALINSKKLSLDGPTPSLTWFASIEANKHDDAVAVGWDEVPRLKLFSAYRFQFVPAGSGWVGEIVFDRQNQNAYVNAGVL